MKGFMLFASTVHPAPDGTAPIHIPQDMLNTPNGKHANNLHKPITPHKEALISNNDAVSFVMLPRIKFGADHNLQYARDVNETADLAPRATLNPRVHFSYDQSITQEHTIGTEEWHEGGWNDLAPFATDGHEDTPWINTTTPHHDPVVSPITGNVTEDADTTPVTTDSLTASGNIIANNTTDIDPNDTHSITAVNGDAGNVGNVIHGTYGDITVNADGTYTYTLNNGTNGTASTVQDLAQGETVKDVFHVTVSDNHGGTATQDLTITVHGTNDAPATVDDTNHISEGATTPATGNIITNDHDIDHGAVVTVAQVAGSADNVGHSVTGTYGHVTINTDGTYAYTIDNTNPAVQALGVGETLTETFHVMATDEHGAQTPETLTITIDGSNEAPVVTPITGSVTEDATLTSAGNIMGHMTDIDTSDTHSITAVNGAAGNVGSAVTGTYGSLTVNADGTYTYALNNGTNGTASTVQDLAKGESVTDVFQVTVSDNHGGTATQDLTITVHGSNDAPVTVDDTNHISEGATKPVTGDVISNDHDIDHGAVVTVAQVAGSADNVGHSVTGTYGHVTINTDGTYAYTIDNTNPAVQALAVGETLTDTFQVMATDEHGAQTPETLTITIDGSNENPVVTPITAGDVTEDTTLISSGNDIITGHTTDVDTSDTHTVTAVNGAAGNVGSAVTGTYGSLTVNADGTYTYTLNNGTNGTASTVQDLAQGETVKDVFHVTVSDNHGGTATQDLTITVHGTNDAPATVDDTNHISEGATTPATGNIITNDHDIDHGAVVTVAQVAGSADNVGHSVTGTYGHVTINTDGTYAYTIDNTNPAVQALGVGETLTETFHVIATDEHGAQTPETLTITIDGSNEAPVVTPITGSVTEDATLTSAGNIMGHMTDIDTSDTHSITAVNGAAGNVGSAVTGTYGSLTVNADGTYTYTLNNGTNGTASTVQDLAKGETVTDVFNVTVSDNHGGTATQDLTITVHGSNDTPLLSAQSGDLQAVTETEGNNFADITTSGTLTVTDIDVKDIVTNIKVDHIDAPVITGGATLPSALTTDILSKMLTFTGGDNSTTSTGEAHNITWTFNPNTSGLTGDNAASLKAFDFLGVGDTIKITYYVKATDNSGVGTTPAAPDNSDTSNLIPVTITITGTNDAPELIADVKSVAEASDSTSPTITPTYNLLTNDSDVDTPHTQLIVTKVGTTDVSSAGSDIAGKYGTLHIQSNGSYYYTLDNTNTEVNALYYHSTSDYGKLVDTFEGITVSDQDGATGIEKLTINITGANDKPVLDVVTTGTPDTTAHSFDETNAALSTTGTLTVTDVDTVDKVTSFKVDSVSHVMTEGGVETALPAAYTDAILKSMLTLKGGDNSTTSNGGAHNVTWTFDSGVSTLGTDALKAFDFLGAGDTLTLTYTVHATDNSGQSNADSGTQTITVTINGTNDAPVLANDSQTIAEKSDTTDATVSPNYNLLTNDTDVDQGTTLTVTKVGSTTVNSTDTTITGTYGTLHIKSDGTYYYSLDNTNADVNALHYHGTSDYGTLTETFTDVTVSDGDGASKTETLTFNITGANDRPDITVDTTKATPDSNTGSLSESGSALVNDVTHVVTTSVSGTLSLNDVDVKDTVTIGSTLTSITGPTTGLPANFEEVLTNMFKVDDGSGNSTVIDSTHTNGTIAWKFDAGSENFNYLASGETLTLVYKVTATDNSGQINDNDTQDVTITIHGENEAADIIVADANTTVEDTTAGCSGNVLTNDTTDGHVSSISWTDSNGTSHTAAVDNDHSYHNITVTDYSGGVSTTIGTLSFMADGQYTFKPAANFSGKVPQFTYHLSNNSETEITGLTNNTLDINVTPVSDTPAVTGSEVSGNENTAIALGLTLPVITDATDLNGTAAGSGDNPERLGYIEIKGIPDTAVVKNGTEALTTDSGTLHIIISDKAGYQLSTLATTGTGVYTMTQAQFAALTIQQYNNADHTSVYAHANISDMTINATSYEVDDAGAQISGVAGAPSTAYITVGVQAVTDATPTLSMTATALPGDEDSTFEISGSTIFTPGLTTVNDVDGSEKVTFRVSGLKSGSEIFYDSDTYTAGSTGVINIPLVKNITDATVAIKDFTMKAPANFSGDIADIKFSLVTQDTDSDSATPAEKIATADGTLTLHVKPVTDSITALNTIQASGYEDTPVSLSGKILPRTNDLDGSQKFNVKIDDIKPGSTIIYDGHSYTVGDAGTTGDISVVKNADGTFSVTINDFDSTKLSYQAPKDENGTETLKVSAQTYDQAVVNGATVTSPVSDWTGVKDMIIQVKGVADEPSIQAPGASELTFTEAQAEAHQVYINNLVVRSGDTTDGSEKATVRITGLTSQYSLAGDDVVYLGQSNASDATTRSWLVKLSGDPSKAYVTTPDNFSGDIKLTAQAVTSENDGNSAVSAATDVTLHVTPTPEATIALASTLTEDTLSQISFTEVYKNGDTDETLGAVYIKASDVNSEHVKIYYSDDGTAANTMTFDNAITAGKAGVSTTTIGGVEYYKLDTAAQTHVYAEGGANYSSESGATFAVKYDITDYKNADQTSSSVTPVTSQFDGTYNLAIKPVTDPTSMKASALTDYSEPTDAPKLDAAMQTIGSVDSVVVTTTGSGTYQMHVTVNSPTDAVNGTDLDGSEHLTQLVVKGVPDGVTITSAGWTYYGDDGAGTNTGMWIKTVNEAFTTTNATISDDIKFTVNSGSENLWALNGHTLPISVTAVTQDVAGALTGDETVSTTAATHYLHISYTGEGDAVGWAASPITISNPTVSGTEDADTTLSTLLNAKIDETTKDYRFSITLSGLKEGTIIGEGVHAITVGADGKYTISGYGNNADLQSLLSSTKVTLPTDFNDNNGSGTSVTATYTTYGQKGTANPSDTPASGTANSDYTITPVTDGMTIHAASTTPTVAENQAGGTGTIDFSLGLNSGTIGSNADGKYETIVDGKIYIKLTDNDNNPATDPMTGTITYNGHTYSATEVTGKSSAGVADGTYYVLDAGTNPFETSTSVNMENLAYKPADFYSGTISLTALAIAQEAGAANTVLAHDSLNINVTPENSEYTLTAANASGNEDSRAVLNLTSTLTDPSETVRSVVISGFPAAGGTSNFLVYAGADADHAVLASKFYDSTSETYEWSVNLNADGTLPAYIAVQGLNNYSGVQNVTVTALHGENGMETTTSKTFDVTLQPVADGLNSFAPDPVLVDGTHANGQIPFNLNANMLDTDGSETASFTFKGLGDGVTIYNGSTILTPHYDTDNRYLYYKRHQIYGPWKSFIHTSRSWYWNCNYRRMDG
jgi:VCBS repeat-containing protein